MTSLAPIFAAACAAFPLPPAGTHGPRHWLRVLHNGRALAARTPFADRDVVELFALLHDCCRLCDGPDPEHGDRAAAFARRLAEDGTILLAPHALDLLTHAIVDHERGTVSPDPTIGACWDADRLDLSRQLRPINPRLLSTGAARNPELQRAAWRRGVTDALDPRIAAEFPIAGPSEAVAIGGIRTPPPSQR